MSPGGTSIRKSPQRRTFMFMAVRRVPEDRRCTPTSLDVRECRWRLCDVRPSHGRCGTGPRVDADAVRWIWHHWHQINASFCLSVGGVSPARPVTSKTHPRCSKWRQGVPVPFWCGPIPTTFTPDESLCLLFFLLPAGGCSARINPWRRGESLGGDEGNCPGERIRRGTVREDPQATW